MNNDPNKYVIATVTLVIDGQQIRGERVLPRNELNSWRGYGPCDGLAQIYRVLATDVIEDWSRANAQKE